MENENLGSIEEENTKNKWLKRLQQESWELELLVSGFSIILLTSLIDSFEDTINYISLHYEASDNVFISIVIIFFYIFALGAHAMIVNLGMHLILRGFWVGVVGLGSVVPNTDFDKLNYGEFFTKKLKSKLISLEDLTLSIDKISSVIFSFTFLLIFLLVSLAIFFALLGCISLIGNYIIEGLPDAYEDFLVGGLVIFVAILIFTGFIYLIDFLTLGYLKKIKWLAKIYYPVYRFYSFLTLSFIYRTIYYNLISKFSKWRIGIILIPYLFIIFFSQGFALDYHRYFPDTRTDTKFLNNFYADLRLDDSPIERADIPSRIIKDNYLPLFIPYNPDDNETIKKLCPDFEPSKKEGLQSGVKITKNGLHIGSPTVKEKNPEKALACVQSLYKIHFNDSLISNVSFYFYTHPNKKERGIITMLDLNKLVNGKHELNIEKYRIRGKNDSLVVKPYVKIPFWLDR